MPTINISPKVRFALYLIGVVGTLLVQYLIDKAWFGDSEFRLWAGVTTVLFALAASKTNLSDDGTAHVKGTVTSETGETGHIAATLGLGEEDPDGGDVPLTYEELGGQPYDDYGYGGPENASRH